MAIGRDLFGLCAFADGELFVSGGVQSSHPSTRLASVERYDPSLDMWSAAPDLPRPRFAHCTCAVDDALYVLGGREQDDEGNEDTVRSVLKFDSQMQIWSEVAPMPAARERAGTCVLGSDIYIFGGLDDEDESTPTTYRFSIETNEWATLAAMPEAKYDSSVCVFDSQIFLVGGMNSDYAAVSSVHRFDPVANSWSAVAPMSVARSRCGAFVLGGSIYVVGGFNGVSRVASMERYCIATDKWSDVRDGELCTARSSFGAHMVRLEMDLFDSLIAKAKLSRR